MNDSSYDDSGLAAFSSSLSHFEKRRAEAFPFKEAARPLTPGEIDALLHALAREPETPIATVIALVLLTGQPPEDLLDWRWNSHFTGFFVGEDEADAVPAGAIAHDLLLHFAENQSAGALVFDLGDGLPDQDDIEAVLARVAEDAGRPTLTFADLQATYEYVAYFKTFFGAN